MDPLPRWFARVQIGVGPPAFTEETRLLRLDGYGGVKVWFEADGGYMPELASRHVGVGLWGAISYLTSSPSDIADSLEELDYFVGAELPIRLGGRALALMFAPRLGFAGGKVSLGAGVPSQNAFVWGAQLGAFSSDYHLGGAIGMLSAAVGPPGSGGRDHDLGGLSVTVGGMFDER
jgi:hypothetical protein